jgi:uncharacterized protein YlxP (DUF503 family)
MKKAQRLERNVIIKEQYFAAKQTGKRTILSDVLAELKFKFNLSKEQINNIVNNKTDKTV